MNEGMKDELMLCWHGPHRDPAEYIEDLERAIAAHGGVILRGEFVLREGKTSSVYVDWHPEDHGEPETPPGWDEFVRAREEIQSGTARVLTLDEVLRLIDDPQARQEWLDARRAERGEA